MKSRSLKTLSLLFASVSAIMGSGWLFAAYHTTVAAGPASILAWIIGAACIIIVAFTFAELSAFVPVTGASIRVPRYTHGVLVGFIFSWILWLSYLALMAIEVQAMIQYANYFIPDLVYPGGGLTSWGYGVATGLMLIITVLNMYSLRWLMRCNSLLTVLKIIIPILIAGAILMVQMPTTHFKFLMPSDETVPFSLKGVLSAISAGGIIFSFNGFKQASEMSGEAKHPSFSLPIAIVGSIVVCLLIFVFLQIAFLSTIHNMSDLEFWHHVQMGKMNSPFSVILSHQNLHSLLPVLYLGAVLGPFAAGMMYCSSAARSLYAISRNDSLPKWLCDLTHGQGMPYKAILVNFVLGMCLFAPFPGWDSMAKFLTSLMALSYAIAPVSLLVLRRSMGNRQRFFKLPFATVWCFVAFYICTLIFYWSGWDVIYKFCIAFFIGLAILLIYRYGFRRSSRLEMGLKTSLWIWPYFIGMTIISYLGNFNGLGLITMGWSFVWIGLLSLVCLIIAYYCAYDNDTITSYIEQLQDE